MPTVVGLVILFLRVDRAVAPKLTKMSNSSSSCAGLTREVSSRQRWNTDFPKQKKLLEHKSLGGGAALCDERSVLRYPTSLLRQEMVGFPFEVARKERTYHALERPLFPPQKKKNSSPSKPTEDTNTQDKQTPPLPRRTIPTNQTNGIGTQQVDRSAQTTTAASVPPLLYIYMRPYWISMASWTRNRGPSGRSAGGSR